MAESDKPVSISQSYINKIIKKTKMNQQLQKSQSNSRRVSTKTMLDRDRLKRKHRSNGGQFDMTAKSTHSFNQTLTQNKTFIDQS